MFGEVDFTKSLEEELKKNPSLKKDADFFHNKYELIKSLVDIRKSLNLTKEEIASRSGIPIKVISKIENINSDVRLDVFLRYTVALGVKINLEECL
ncbi:helix-turn-helix transcriptional regulator [Clostridium sp. YIM B02506]|uniref:helix-turn-helix domain-containing protein n=1 Tax=Clostridium sp. YIM B02506 TaxID=2910680 RepID=UPI001EEF3679|nr:helix-turn-helix transcriptional regulator [Clostridium sp. YIM B02506]